MKTSAVAVRSVLRDGLEHPSGYQTARTGLAAPKRAIRLYRDGQGEDTSRYAASPFSLHAARYGKGDDALAAGRPLLGIPRLGRASFIGHGIAVLTAVVAITATFPAHAGRSCESRKPVPPQVIERGMKLAEQTSAALDAEHAKSGDIEALVDYCHELAAHLSDPLHERGTHSG